MSDRIQFGLLENALDYILGAAEHARKDEPRDWKYALLHLVAGVELLVKARLGREHWSLLFADVDKASAAALQSGDFKSVDFEVACERLQKIGTVPLDREDLRHLTQLRKLRNRAQHFDIDVDAEQVKSLLAKGVSFFIEFSTANLSDEMDALGGALLKEIHSHLRHFEEFVDDRIAAIDSSLRDAPDILECPRCWQDTLVVGQGAPNCRFCKYETTAEDLAQSIGEGPVDEECPNCGQRTLCFVLYSNEAGADYCTSCGTANRICLSCRRYFTGTSELCPECSLRGSEPGDVS